ncbi:MAG: TetR/AcrR family transcriptional regulator [Solirubrobacteraceae bacterium]
MATREERKAQTRERLLDAARGVFAARGFHAASVDEIADAAGFSSGALYSNFDGKEDLFLELLRRELGAQALAVERAVGHPDTIAERARAGAAEWMTFVEREPSLLMLVVEFWAYAARDPDVRPKVAAHFAEVRAVMTRLIVDGARELGLELLLPPEQLAIAIDALAEGIARQQLTDPAAVDEHLLADSVSILIAGASRPRGS